MQPETARIEMQNNNTTEKQREMMLGLQQTCLHLAIGFERAAAGEMLIDERKELLRSAADALREMQEAVVSVASRLGVGFTFEPNDHTHWMCIYCMKPLNTHVGRDCKCQTGS